MKKKTRRIGFVLLLLGAAALAGCSSLSDFSTGKKADSGSGDEDTVYKVAIVQYVDDASLNQIESNIEAELDAKGEELGVVFDYEDHTYNGEADPDVFDQITQELQTDPVDLIIPIATPAARAICAADYDPPVPIVFSAVSDPVRAGLVDSMELPGSHVTGVSDALDTEMVFDLMFTANPEIKKVGLLYDLNQDASQGSIEAARELLREKQIEYVEETGTTQEEISAAADRLVEAGVDAVFTPTDNTVMTAELSIYHIFIDADIPHYAGADSFALNGAFCGCGVNYNEIGRETADLAVDILVNGKDPASIPVRTLNNGIVMVNTETAAAIGADYSSFTNVSEEVVETVTKQEFDD